MSNSTKNKINASEIPVINLSPVELRNKELNQLSFGLDHSYIEKNKHVKKDLVASFKSLVQKFDSEFLNKEREDFYEF